jgi:hypothetical protein
MRQLLWESVDSASEWAAVPEFWMCYRISLRSDRQKVLRLEWLGNRNDELGLFLTWDGAREAARADFAARLEAWTKPPAKRVSNPDGLTLGQLIDAGWSQ